MKFEPAEQGTTLYRKPAKPNPWWGFPALLILNGLIALAVWLALKGAG